MRFDSVPKREARPVTTRRLKAAERALRQEREKFPLLSDWIAEQQPTAEERIDRYQVADAQRQQAMRDSDAQTWRRARRLLRCLPEDVRRACLDDWNAHHCPGDASYFANHVFRVARPHIDAGEIVLPDPMLDPRYALELMLTQMRQEKLKPR